MNKEVNFEIAKLLKEKGYDETTQLIYMTNHTSEVLFENINSLKHSDGDNPFCSAPTIAEVVMWLYEKHGIWVYINRYTNKPVGDAIWGNCFQSFVDGDAINVSIFKTPTEAYSAGIIYTLNNLIK